LEPSELLKLIEPLNIKPCTS